eukprot:2545384-Pyramimonas_sp.AAC.1
MLIPKPPDAEGIMVLSKSFKRSTIAADGFHPRRYHLLSRPALVVFSLVMGFMTVLGSAPSWMRKLVVALFQKPVSGR